MSYHRETSDVVPDKYSYTTVISAYGRSNAKRKAAKAHWVLQRMIDDGNSKAKPNTYAFNAVLNSCALHDILKRKWRHLQSYVQP